MLRPVDPVGHNETVKAPFLTQNAAQQVCIFGGIDAVQQVISCHDCPDIRFFDNDPERLEINLPQGTLRHARVAGITVRFLIVAAEMLDAGGNVLRLNALHHCRRQLARDQRVFGIILEVPAAERTSVDVDGGRQPHADVIFAHFLRARFADRVDDIRVPCAGQQRRHRPCRRLDAALRHDAQTRRAVRRHDRRNAQLVQTADALRVGHAPVRRAAEQRDELVVRKAVQEFIDGGLACGNLLKAQAVFRKRRSVAIR